MKLVDDLTSMLDFDWSSGVMCRFFISVMVVDNLGISFKLEFYVLRWNADPDDWLIDFTFYGDFDLSDAVCWPMDRIEVLLPLLALSGDLHVGVNLSLVFAMKFNVLRM